MKSRNTSNLTFSLFGLEYQTSIKLKTKTNKTRSRFEDNYYLNKTKRREREKKKTKVDFFNYKKILKFEYYSPALVFDIRNFDKQRH